MSESALETSGRSSDSATETGPQLRAVGVTIDCADPARIADFWQAAIGFSTRVGNGRPYITLSEASDGRMLNHLTIQRVPEAKTAKLRAHLDLFTRDMDSEVARRLRSARPFWCPPPPRPPVSLSFVTSGTPGADCRKVRCCPSDRCRSRARRSRECGRRSARQQRRPMRRRRDPSGDRDIS